MTHRAIKPPKKILHHNPLTSKAFWGATAAAVAKITADHSPASIAEAVGGVLSVVGMRDAIAKITP